MHILYISACLHSSLSPFSSYRRPRQLDNNEWSQYWFAAKKREAHFTYGKTHKPAQNWRTPIKARKFWTHTHTQTKGIVEQ